jgi:hypothetical protein
MQIYMFMNKTRSNITLKMLENIETKTLHTTAGM